MRRRRRGCIERRGICARLPRPLRRPRRGAGAEAERGNGGGGRGFGRGGPLVKPGNYNVSLGKLVNGQLTQLGQPQTVEVVPLER